ncbi:transmembrane and immunoglobulin domain-containing protein 1 isoform X1 [Tachyglossus aculeatus]|uniref:transmembrane and immunoglobulin domain-containing protein 1 isoform X1 n=1 Tax=Tachyglossus aculeatus TaxID=9261 RepID=UPI0018F77844|nr:transmembrane and immunoglobulin domain-containing protein 1 isoform X1 [Tachyglossus aculeatus]
MAQKSSGLMQTYGFLCLMISLLPCGETSVTLTVNDYPGNHTLDTQSGSIQSLKCAVHNHSREEELLWYREDGQVDLKPGNKINTSYICVSPLSENDHGVTFTCKLQRDHSVQISVILNVTFPPALSEEDTQTAEEGNNVLLTCNAKSNPQAQMAWYRNNSTLVLEKGRHQIQQTSDVFQLSIATVKKSDNGTYTCIANSTSILQRMDFHLIVQDKKFVVPMEPIIAAMVVVLLTISFGIFARRERIRKFCTTEDTQSDIAL